MEAGRVWSFQKLPAKNLMDAQINTQWREVAIQSLQCYNYSSFCLLDKHKGGFFSLPTYILFLLLSSTSRCTAWWAGINCSRKLWKHNKCFSAWYNCVCRSLRAWEERGLCSLQERLCVTVEEGAEDVWNNLICWRALVDRWWKRPCLFLDDINVRHYDSWSRFTQTLSWIWPHRRHTHLECMAFIPCSCPSASDIQVRLYILLSVN